MIPPIPRNPRAEANALLPDGYEARVLEPSPPANQDPEWFADDPTDPSGGTRTVVSPTSDGDITWDAFVGDHPDLATYAADHWVGSWRRLAPLPAAYVQSRRSLHQLAFYAIAPRGFAANGKVGLRYTHRGFGTPFFGEDEQVRVEGRHLIFQRGDQVRAEPVTTLTDAARFLGIEYAEKWFDDLHDPLEPTDPDTILEVEEAAGRALGDWYGFAYSVLEEARRFGSDTDGVSRVQLWPEHFDPAFEMGDTARGQRASYGASPGDDLHAEPYLYVAAWGEIDRSNTYWNNESFNGASLSYSDLLSASDQRREALEFLAAGCQALTGVEPRLVAPR